MKYFCRFSECLRGESGGGSYFNDYCNWQNIPEFRDLIYDSPAAQVAGKLMKSKVGIWAVFTQGQFWPSGIVVACMCDCVSVCPP